MYACTKSFEKFKASPRGNRTVRNDLETLNLFSLCFSVSIL